MSLSLSKKTLLLLLIVWIYAMNDFKKWKDNFPFQYDVAEYYSYLPATFIKHDLSYKFLESEKEGSPWKNVATKPLPEGKRYLKMTMGLSFLYLPFFLIAHLIAGWFGFARDGFSEPYQIMIAFSSIFYAFLGLCILRKLLLKYFTEFVTAVTLVLLVVGTNLWASSLVEIGMGHPYLFMLFALFIYLSIKWLEEPTVKRSVAAGLTIGLITLIRPTDILILVVPILLGVSSFKDLSERFKYFWEHRSKIFILCICMFLVFIPQIVHWKYLTGHWLFYSYGEERFYFLKPHILSGLFSYRKGWLLYTPVMIFGLAGIFFLKKYAKEYFWLILSFTVLNIWIVYSWWCWYYGGSFGSRAMIESYALLAFPLAAFIQFIIERKKWFLKVVFIYALHFVIWLNLFQTNQYRKTILHWSFTSKELYFTAFGTMDWPPNYEQLLKRPKVEEGGWEDDSEIEKIWD